MQILQKKVKTLETDLEIMKMELAYLKSLVTPQIAKEAAKGDIRSDSRANNDRNHVPHSTAEVSRD